MKLITLNFGTWNNGARGGRLRRIYQRIYIKGYKWTPFVTVRFKLLPKQFYLLFIFCVVRMYLYYDTTMRMISCVENNKQLILSGVSQQRELLARYTKWQGEYFERKEDMYNDIDKFLGS